MPNQHWKDNNPNYNNPNYDKWWTGQHDEDETENEINEDRPISPIERKKRKKKRIVKKKLKPHSPDNHFRRIQLLIECRCQRPRICKKTTCHHYGIHEFDKNKCGKRACNFVKIKFLRYHSSLPENLVKRLKKLYPSKNGKEILGKPFKYKTDIKYNIYCKMEEKNG